MRKSRRKMRREGKWEDVGVAMVLSKGVRRENRRKMGGIEGFIGGKKWMENGLSVGVGVLRGGTGINGKKSM